MTDEEWTATMPSHHMKGYGKADEDEPVVTVPAAPMAPVAPVAPVTPAAAPKASDAKK